MLLHCIGKAVSKRRQPGCRPPAMPMVVQRWALGCTAPALRRRLWPAAKTSPFHCSLAFCQCCTCSPASWRCKAWRWCCCSGLRRQRARASSRPNDSCALPSWQQQLPAPCPGTPAWSPGHACSWFAGVCLGACCMLSRQWRRNAIGLEFERLQAPQHPHSPTCCHCCASAQQRWFLCRGQHLTNHFGAVLFPLCEWRLSC